MTEISSRLSSPAIADVAARSVWPKLTNVLTRPRRLAPLLACAWMILMAGFAVMPHWFTAYDPLEGDVLASLAAPNAERKACAINNAGEHIAPQFIGAQKMLGVGLGAVAISVAFGVLLGLIAGQRQRVLDEGFSRLFDVISAYPGVLLAMLLITFLGGSLVNVAIAVGIAGIPKFGRVVRAQTKAVQDADYVVQASIYGRSRLSAFLVHVVPNVLTVVPVVATISVGTAILTTSGLSFLGLGPQPPTPEWGLMLAESRDYLRTAWWTGVFPGVAITLTVIAFAVLGGSLQRHIEGRAP